MIWPKSAGFKQRLTIKIENFKRSANQLPQLELSSSGISSSQPNLMRHRSWRISFAVRTKNAWKPKGSKILPVTDRIPPRVRGRKLQNLKRNESETTHSKTLLNRLLVQKGVGDFVPINISCLTLTGITAMTVLPLSCKVWCLASALCLPCCYELERQRHRMCQHRRLLYVSHRDWCVKLSGAFLNSLQFRRSFSKGTTLAYADWRGTRSTVCWTPETELFLDTVSIAMADNLQGHGYCYNRDTDVFFQRKWD